MNEMEHYDMKLFPMDILMSIGKVNENKNSFVRIMPKPGDVMSLKNEFKLFRLYVYRDVDSELKWDFYGFTTERIHSLFLGVYNDIKKN